MPNEIIKKSDLFNYSFFDEDNELVTVVNEEFLKKLFKSNTILLHEDEHK